MFLPPLEQDHYDSAGVLLAVFHYEGLSVIMFSFMFPLSRTTPEGAVLHKNIVLKKKQQFYIGMEPYRARLLLGYGLIKPAIEHSIP